jgi:transposase, IS5 family
MKIIRRKQMKFEDFQLEQVIKPDHLLYKIKQIVNLKKLTYRIKDIEISKAGRKGFGLEVAIGCLLLQFLYDLSDRGLEERLRYDISFRWFLELGLSGETPDHTFACRSRKAIGTKRIGQIFRYINKKAEESGIIRNVFHFADASSIISKETTWAERDKAIKAGEDSFNNDNADKYGADKDARFGCKGKNKFWYGHKKNIVADMGSGLITKVAVTDANMSDQEAFKYVCPKGGMVFGDKAYCLKPAQIAMQKNGCHSGAILKNNMIGKNKDLDRWISSVRAPFEGIFSKQEKRARYRGRAKIQLQAFMDSIVHNLKRLIVINDPNFCVC